VPPFGDQRQDPGAIGQAVEQAPEPRGCADERLTNGVRRPGGAAFDLVQGVSRAAAIVAKTVPAVMTEAL